MSRRLPHCEMTMARWEEVCAWLDAQPGKARYWGGFPFEWQWLFISGSPEASEARRLANWPVFYQPGHGWRLRKNWRERLAAPEGSYWEAWQQRAQEEKATVQAEEG